MRGNEQGYQEGRKERMLGRVSEAGTERRAQESHVLQTSFTPHPRGKPRGPKR